MSKIKLAIVGIFFDGYYDVWEDFLTLFNLHWKDCQYPLYIVDNEKDLEFEKDYNIQLIKAGKDAEYSRKVQKALEMIDAEYYLLLLEDFFIQKNLQKNCLDQIISLMENRNISYYRMTIPDFMRNKKIKNILSKIEKEAEYTVTCQPSIWKRDFLVKCIGRENYNAWVFEGIYAFSSDAHSESFLNACLVDRSNPLSLRHGAVQGKMLPNVYADFLQDGYTFKNNREILNKKAFFLHKVRQWGKAYLPFNLQKMLKKLFRRQSVFDRYEQQIRDVMHAMDLK